MPVVLPRRQRMISFAHPKDGPARKNPMKALAHVLVIIGLISLASVSIAQSPRQQKPKTTSANTQPDVPSQDQDVETLKIDTNLVTVPVIASSRLGTYIADLKKEEFKLSEDGVSQEISFLATVNAPFDLVLLLDTSPSTKDKLPQIQRAAITFL